MNREHYKDEKVEYAIKSLYKLYTFYCKIEKNKSLRRGNTLTIYLSNRLTQIF